MATRVGKAFLHFPETWEKRNCERVKEHVFLDVFGDVSWANYTILFRKISNSMRDQALSRHLWSVSYRADK